MWNNLDDWMSQINSEFEDDIQFVLLLSCFGGNSVYKREYIDSGCMKYTL